MARNFRPDERESAVTPESLYRQRRRFLQLGAAGALGLVTPVRAALFGGEAAPPPGTPDFPDLARHPSSTEEPPNSWRDITTYNNFYEFGAGKGDPAENAHSLVTDPWSVTIEGEVAKAGTFALEDILRPHAPEELSLIHI